MDLVGAADVFTSANRAAGGEPLYDIKIVNAEKAPADRKISGMCELSLYCDADFRSFRGKIDTLLVPGGIGVEEGKPDAAAVRWLQQAAAHSRRVGSICTGAFLLARAGLLDGRRVAAVYNRPGWYGDRSWPERVASQREVENLSFHR
jgi:transcriptional regulator GlxA family with amidase domain